jgi:predicted AAA+ superfamily ATPase
MKEYIDRPYYIKKIKPFIGKSLIKVLTGQRRVGKSYLLMQISDIINEEHPDTQIIYINKERNEFSMVTDSDTLLDYLYKM